MKKLLIAFLAMCISAFCIIPFAGCDSGWVEVQSITYTTMDGEETTYTSMCIWDIADEIVSKAEYENAPNDHKGEFFNFSNKEIIDVNRQEFIVNANKKIGETYYSYQYFYPDWNNEGNKVSAYVKGTYTNYTLEYVKVKFVENDHIEIDYEGEIIELSPLYLNDQLLPYTITYFNE